ncbi:MAG: PhnD/SsuA/transferrin family substrate-binding protein [Candidatus Thiodiazotropha sp.]
MSIRTFAGILCMLIGTSLPMASLGADVKNIDEIAIFPYLSPQKLVQLYQPLAQNLGVILDHPVRVVSAPDYVSFMSRIANQEYLLVVTASHMARMAQLDSNYISILRPITDLEAVAVVPRASPLRNLSELRGATVGVPSRIALITQIAVALLRDAGLEPGQDVTLVYHPTHSSAVMEVVNGLADAAVVSSRAMNQIGEKLGDKVRVLSDSSKLNGTVPGQAPPIIYQVSSELDNPARDELAKMISNFANHTDEGRAFINQFGYQGLRPLTLGELEAMDPFLPALRVQLRQEGK